MSNRIMGILIILGFIGAGYIWYNLKYIPSQNNIEKNASNIEEKKEIELVQLDKKIVKISNDNKIDELKLNKTHYKTFILDNKKAYFLENKNDLDLYLEEKFIGKFEFAYKDDLNIFLAKGSNNVYLIEVRNKKFLFFSKNNILKQIDLNIVVEYLKISNENIIIKTSKGSFIYNSINGKLNYYNFFTDFVYYNNGVVGIIKSSDITRINNLGFINNYKDLIVYYNSDTKEKIIIFETKKDINKIYFENNIILENETGDKFVLENY